MDHATAVLLRYWDNLYSGLASDFYATRKEISNLRASYGYGNNDLPAVIRAYCRSNYPLLSVYPSTIWNPFYDTYTNYIDSGNPVLLGFATGYGEPHMTVGCGYTNYNLSIYGNWAIVMDGHSSNYVYKLWTPSNDFILSFK